MFNAVLGYILDLNTGDAPESTFLDIKKNVDYAIGQVSIEVRIPILTILFLNLTWFIVKSTFFGCQKSCFIKNITLLNEFL